MSGWRIVADVGGTNVRFARAGTDTAIDRFRSWENAPFPSFTDALGRYVSEIGGIAGCAGICIAAAGPVQDGAVQLTNGKWLIGESEVSRFAGGLPVRLINDLEAVALAVPHLAAASLAHIGPVESAGRGVKIAVNVGTGFGASIAVPFGTYWTAIPCEPGHMRLALAESDRQLLGCDACSVEDVLSGLGLRNIHARLRQHESASPDRSELSDIFAHASRDESGAELLRIFGALLGQISGDLVLATGAWGGVYLCGGLAAAWAPHALQSEFRRRFEDKGPMSSRMRGVFTGHITNRNAALDGLARLRFA